MSILFYLSVWYTSKQMYYSVYFIADSRLELEEALANILEEEALDRPLFV